MPYADAIQLVANIGGNHHIICFNTNNLPVIYIFDAQLHLQGQKEIDMKLKEASDLRLLPFKNFYFLYAHVAGTLKHELFKIAGDGNVIPLTKPFQQFIEREFFKTTSTLQLINQNEKLYVLGHTYYDAIKKISSNVVELDAGLNTVLGRKVAYSFNREQDVLQQTILAGNSMLVLKTLKDDEKGNSLDVIKVDLSSGHSVSKSFNSGSHVYANAAFNYQPADSTILVYSLVRQPVNSERLQQTVFITQLNNALQEVVPVSILKSQFRNSTAANYFLFRDSWFALNSNLRIRRSSVGSLQNPETAYDPSALSMINRPTLSSSYFVDYNQPAAVRFTILNQKLVVAKDSTVANDKKVYDVQPRPFAQFTINNKGYLFLIQNFSSDRRGLLMLNTNDNGQLTSTDIPVFDKYHYLLPQAKAVNNKFILVPYSHKSDIGLVKISFD